MSATKDEAKTTGRKVVMQTLVQGPISRISELCSTMGEERVEFCRIEVIGEAGPATNPPRVTLYIQGGRGSTRHDEAQRCARGLNLGDWIEAAGDIGPERASARRQEILVSEPVKLRARAVSPAGAA